MMLPDERVRIPMKIVVIGAGAWGLPAAAELAQRGHQVILVDRFGLLNRLSSSCGPTRMWRIPDPDPRRVRLSKLGLAAMERLARRSGATVYLRKGLLWRDTKSLPRLQQALASEDVRFEAVESRRVGEYLPGLVPDGRDAVWQEDAGVVLAESSLRAQFGLFSAAGGTFVQGETVRESTLAAGSARVLLSDGQRIEADAAVIAAGPGSGALLAQLGLPVPLRTYKEQVVHLGDGSAAADAHPCFFDGPAGDAPGIYAMASPGIGYKVGLDAPLRLLGEADTDRTPDPDRTGAIRDRVRRSIRSVKPQVVDAQVCTWTDTPDGQFVVDSPLPGLVVACGDVGEGFKYSALMGIIVADLAEGNRPEADISPYRIDRFGVQDSAGWSAPTALGR
jgi:sarcosine oxidase